MTGGRSSKAWRFVPKRALLLKQGHHVNGLLRSHLGDRVRGDRLQNVREVALHGAQEPDQALDLIGTDRCRVRHDGAGYGADRDSRQVHRRASARQSAPRWTGKRGGSRALSRTILTQPVVLCFSLHASGRLDFRRSDQARDRAAILPDPFDRSSVCKRRSRASVTNIHRKPASSGSTLFVALLEPTPPIPRNPRREDYEPLAPGSA